MIDSKKISLDIVCRIINKNVPFCYCSLNDRDFNINLDSLDIYNKKNLIFTKVKDENGLIYCPESKQHSLGTFWFHISQERVEQLRRFQKSFIIFRLNQIGLGLVKFSKISSYLNQAALIIAENKNYFNINIEDRKLIIAAKESITFNTTNIDKNPGSIIIKLYEINIDVFNAEDIQKNDFRKLNALIC